MKNTKYLIITGLCIALGVVLPIAFHVIPNAGRIMLPMHIPVLLCGLICGPIFGLICGILAPIISSILTSMPAAAMLPSMVCELAVYGAVSGLLIQMIKLKSNVANIYVALVGAMVCGRIVNGILNMLVFQAGTYTLDIWLAAAFVTALPGIVLQLIVIPLVMLALKKAKLV